MVSSQNLFREYIQWRSRMASYAAVALTILLVIGLLAWFVASPININRFGLLLQLLGVLALAPDVVGKEKFPFFRRPAEVVDAPDKPTDETGGPGVDVDAVIDPPEDDDQPPDQVLPEDQFLPFYQAKNLTFLLGNVLASFALVWLLADGVLSPRPDFFPMEGLWRLLFSLLGFSWLNLFMLLQVVRLSGSTAPRRVLAWFFAVDLFVGILGVIFAGLIHILLRWVLGGLQFIFNNGMRRVLLIITLPFLAVGLFFELVATFH
jgi:hypothetical protein